MGAKIHKRRKICALIAGAFLFVSSVFAVLLCANVVNPKVEPPAIDAANVSVDKSGVNYFTYDFPYGGTYDFKLKGKIEGFDPVYYVQVSGGDGERYYSSGGKAGYGATVYGFYKGSNLAVYNSGGSGALTKFTPNFAIKSSGDIIAAGGGSPASYKEEYISYTTNSSTTNTKDLISIKVGLGWNNTSYEALSTSGLSLMSGGNAGYYNPAGPMKNLIPSGFSTTNLGGYLVGDWDYGRSGDGVNGNGSVAQIVYYKKSDQFVRTIYWDSTTTHYNNSTTTTTNSTHYYADAGSNFYLKKDVDVGNQAVYRFCYGGDGGTCSSSSYPLYVNDYSSVGGYGTNISTGMGGVAMAVLNPTKIPSAPAAVNYTGSAISAVTGNGSNARVLGRDGLPNGNIDGKILGGKFYYSVDAGKTWSENPMVTNVGAYTVQWRYVLYGEGGTNRGATASVNNPIICSGSYQFTVKSTASLTGSIRMAGSSAASAVNSAGTSTVTYTGSAIQLIADASALQKNTGTVHFGVTTTKPAGNGINVTSGYISSITSYSQVTATAAGTYYVYYYVDGGGNNYSPLYYQIVNVNKITPSPSGGTGTTLQYTGGGQSLFSGTVSVLGGTISKYRWSNGTTSGGESTTIAGVKPSAIGDYTLQVYVDQSNNLSSYGWFNTGTKGSITKASITVTANSTLTAAATRTYNGAEQAFLNVGDNPLTVKNRDNLTMSSLDAGTWTFERIHTANYGAANLDGVKKTTLAGASASQAQFKTQLNAINKAINAGQYELRISWSGNGNVNAGATTINLVHTINRSNAVADITFNIATDASNQNNSQLYNPGEPISQYGSRLISENPDNKVSVFYKGNYLAGDQLNSGTPDGAGTLSFCFVKATDSAPTATSTGWKEGLDNNNVKKNTGADSIIDYKVSAEQGAGIYSLYLRFKGHNNYTDDTIVKYPTDFRVDNLSADNVTLTGLTYNYGGQINFDGQFHQIASGTFGYAENFITIKPEAVEYCLWDQLNNRIVGNWEKELSAITVRDAGTYSLHLRWGQVPGHNSAGVDYNNVQPMGALAEGKSLPGTFVISQLTDWSALRIEGLSINDTINFDGKMHYFAKEVDDINHPEKNLFFLIKSSTEKDADGSDRWYQLTAEEIAAWFGTPFNFALGFADATTYPEANQYVITIPQTSNAGTYYLYIKWAATNNIAGPTTQRPYEYGKNAPVDMVKSFTINKTNAVDYGNIVARSESERTYRTETVSEDVYQDGQYVETKRITRAKAIPLYSFEKNPQRPTLSIDNIFFDPTQIVTGWDWNNGDVPEVSFKYALTKTDTITKSFDSVTGKYTYPGVIWYDSLEEATADTVLREPNTTYKDYQNDITNHTVAPYYLWILICNDNNIEDDTPILLDRIGAKLLPAEATVAATAFPQANNLTETYDTDSNQPILLNLFMVSEQVEPPVEYTLTPEDPDSWIRVDNPNNFPDALKRAQTGHYYVYFRGGADINHYTQKPDGSGNYVKAVNDKNVEVPSAQYQFLSVVINPPAAGIAVHPTAKKDDNGKVIEFVYNGRPQLLFDPGTGKTQTGGVGMFELEYNFTGNENDNWFTYDYLMKWYEQQKNTTYLEMTDAEMRNNITINAGTYTLYYRVRFDGELAENPICQIHLTINKAPVTGIKPGFAKTSTSPSSPIGDYIKYDGGAHQTITTEAAFNVVGTNWSNESKDASGRTYIGTPGKITYGYSTNFLVPPSAENIFENFNEMQITNAGTYYLWYKIDAGENHLASDWICVHTNANDSPFIINKATIADIDLSWSTDTFGPERYYDGQNVALVTQGELVQKIGTNFVQTAKPNEQLKIWYAVTNSSTFPAENSLVWKDTYLNAFVTEAGEYYLHVKIAAHTNVEKIIATVNLGSPITYHKAKADNLLIQGITIETAMYQGKPLPMATGILCVNTCNADKQVVMYNVPYGTAAYVYWPYSDQAHAPSPEADWQINLYEATCTDAGAYYLWVYLRDSVNLDDVMVCVNANNPAIITPADETYIEIAPLSLTTITEYSANANGVAFITSGASLAMKNDGTLGGNPGTAYYLLRAGDNQTVPNVARDESVENLINQGWTSNFTNVRGYNVGVYQIFVLFVPAEIGCNHTFILPQHMGQVEITKASNLTISFGGFDYVRSQTFTAGQLSLVTNGSTFIQSINGQEVAADSCGEILFAASSSATTQPNIADDEWVDDINNVKGVTAGYYYIWVWVKEGTNVSEYRACLGLDSAGNECAVIEQRTNVVSVTIGGVNPVENLAFNDTYQVLATEELTVKINSNNVPLTMLGSVSWALTEGTTAGVVPDDGEWHTSLAEITARDANYDNQYYWLWIRITATDNVAEIIRAVCQIKIDRAKIEFHNFDPAANLRYNGAEQYLLDWENHGTANYGQVVYRLKAGGSLSNPDDWSTNWQDMVGTDAGLYNVYYAVLHDRNWVGESGILECEIAAATASFYDLPTAQYTIYNGTMQDLVEFGSLTEDAIAQGVTINFRYHKNTETGNPDYVGEYRDENNSGYYENIWYTYQGDDVWDAINKKLPGGINAGTYTIEYMTTASTQYNSNGTFNFTASEVFTITATMQRRTLTWYTEPTAKQGLRDTGKLQDLLNAGEPSVSGATGLTVQYASDPNDEHDWLSHTWPVVPQKSGIGRYYSYYRVYFNSANNIFWDGNRVWNEDDANENGIVYTTPIELVTLIEKLTISFRRLPEGISVSYDAEPHTLVNFGELSTFLYGDTYSNVYLEYRYADDDGKWYAADDFPQKTAVGQYKIEYRVHGVSDDYSSNKVFEFVGNDTGYIYSEIMAASVTGNGIRAILVNDDQIDFPIGFEVSDAYSEDFKAQLQAADVITYRFRAVDHPDYWHDWQEFHTGDYKNKMGVYQIQARITANTENFDSYEQTEDFYEFKITKDLVLNIHVEGYSTRPLVQAWVDTTGSQSFSDAEYTSGEAKTSSMIIIPNCASSGADGNAKIRIRCLNDRYYYLSNTAITDHQKTSLADGIVLNESLVDKGILSVELSLYTDVYIYEVYKITYEPNFEVAAGNTKPTMAPSWKWHSDNTGDNCEYPLALELDAMNVFAHPLGLKFNGWNASSAGLSDKKYNSSNRFYTENSSVVLYAQWNSGVEFGLVRWQVGDYQITGSDVWFNYVQDPTRNNVGKEVNWGEQIYLPDISNLPSAATNGKYIVKWVVKGEEDSSEFFWDRRVDREEITFVAVLSSDNRNYVTCIFMNDKNDQVSSVTVADGAEGYMAFSGLTANDFKRYNYQQFVDELTGRNHILHAKEDDRIKIFNLGAENIIIDDEPSNGATYQTAGEFTAMIIIIAFGILLAVGAMLVYLMIRNKKIKINFKRFREDKTI